MGSKPEVNEMDRKKHSIYMGLHIWEQFKIRKNIGLYQSYILGKHTYNKYKWHQIILDKY